MEIKLHEHIPIDNYDLILYNTNGEYQDGARSEVYYTMDDIINNKISSLYLNNTSFGLTTHIYRTDLVAIDIDMVPASIFINFDNEDKRCRDFVNRYNKAHKFCKTSSELILYRLSILKTYITEIFDVKKVVVMQSSPGSYHIIIKLNNIQNVKHIYNSKHLHPFMCKGYLKFINTSGYATIRITEKNNKPETKLQLVKCD